MLRRTVQPEDGLPRRAVQPEEGLLRRAVRFGPAAAPTVPAARCRRGARADGARQRRAGGAPQRQAGVTLIESLVSLVVFSIAILGLVSLHASTNRVSQDARFRSEAAMLADELVARMLAADRASVQADYATGGPDFSDWLANRVRAAGSGLPGGNATVTFAAVGGEPLSVRVTITWQPPREAVRNASGIASAQSRQRQHVTVTALYD